MGGMRKEQRDQASWQPRRTPFDIAQGKLRYTIQMRRHRNRRYGVVAALLILGVGIGLAAALLANWLTLAK